MDYIIALDILGKHNFKRFTIYTLWKYLLAREQTLPNFNFSKIGNLLWITYIPYT